VKLIVSVNNFPTTFLCWCLPCTHVAYLAPTLLIMHPRCLPCTHIAYLAPTLLTMHPHCLPCTHVAYLAPTLLTLHPHCLPCTQIAYHESHLNFPPFMEAEVPLLSDRNVFQLFDWCVSISKFLLHVSADKRSHHQGINTGHL
jgi:hypothetical protein